MIREQRRITKQGSDTVFRWRGASVSRLEGFSDAVFGFALTLLVVSLEVPKTFRELLHAMRGFVAFGACFFILFRVWERHYTFFRRYALEDPLTVSLNGLLLFIVLLFVYPLKFVFSLLFNGMLGLDGSAQNVSAILPTDVPSLFVIYGVGFGTVYLIFALLHGHAHRLRLALKLTEVEIRITLLELRHNLMLAGVGFVSVVLALLLPHSLTGFAGFAYFLIGVVEYVHGAAEGGLRRRTLNDAPEK